jgi:hypothetical protein
LFCTFASIHSLTVAALIGAARVSKRFFGSTESRALSSFAHHGDSGG